MQLISTTQLRTKSKDLVATLLAGYSVDLIHRSKKIGTIEPSHQTPKIMTKERIEKIIKMAQKLNLPKLSYKEREKRYREAMLKKHGQSLS